MLAPATLWAGACPQWLLGWDHRAQVLKGQQRGAKSLRPPWAPPEGPFPWSWCHPKARARPVLLESLSPHGLVSVREILK